VAREERVGDPSANWGHKNENETDCLEGKEKATNPFKFNRRGRVRGRNTDQKKVESWGGGGGTKGKTGSPASSAKKVHWKGASWEEDKSNERDWEEANVGFERLTSKLSSQKDHREPRNFKTPQGIGRGF